MGQFAAKVYDRFWGKAKPSKSHHASRSYGAANRNRFNADWTTQTTTSNYETYISITALRARARQMCRDDAFFRKFLQMAESNVIGQAGLQVDPRAKRPRGKYKGELDADLNDKIKTAFWAWGSDPANCSVSGKLDFAAQQRLFIRTLLRDGEVLVVKQRTGPWGFQMKFIDPAYLDELFCTRLPNGNRVIMSVEVDANDKPVRYWLTQPSSDTLFIPNSSSNRVPIAASEVMHAYLIIDDESQVRGITWFHAALGTGKNRNEFRKWVLGQAKMTAMAGGFLIPPENDDGSSWDGEDEDGRPTAPEMDWRPLSMPELPPGYKFDQFDPKQPQQNHAEYNKTLIAEDAAGLGLHYFSLAGDMEAVNYSSARVGLAEERELWRILQDFTVLHFCRPVYDEWVLAAMLSNKLDITPPQLDQVKQPYWRPRGWAYIDPQKEITAQLTGIGSGLLSFTSVLASNGVDLRDHLETLQQERKLLEEFGIPLPTETAVGAAGPGDPNADLSAKDQKDAKKKRAESVL